MNIELCPFHGDLYDYDQCVICERILRNFPSTPAQRVPLTSSDGKDQTDSVLEPKAYPSSNDSAVSGQGGG